MPSNMIRSRVRIATASKSSPVRELPVPVQCAATSQPQLDVDASAKHRNSSRSTARLSLVIQILECLETIAQSSPIPGLYGFFHILVKLLNAVKNTKENSENAKYLLGLSEAHLEIALDSVGPKDDLRFNLPNFLNYFIDTLVDIGDFAAEVKKRGPFASLRHVLSDKRKLQALAERLDDGHHLFLNGSISEVEKRRVSSEIWNEEIATLLSQFLGRLEEIDAKLDQVSTRLDEFKQQSNQDPFKRSDPTKTSQAMNDLKEKAPLHPTNIQPLGSLFLIRQFNIHAWNADDGDG